MKTHKRFRTAGFPVAVLCALAATTVAGTYKHITIDGSFGDWAGVPPAYEDGQDPGEWTDFKTVYVANDENYLYVRFTLYAPREAFTAHNNFYFDTDNDPNTGSRVILGSEMLVEGGEGYQEKNGGFNEGTVSGLNWAAAPTDAATDFEFRVSRNAVFDSDGTAVFGGETIAILLEATDNSWNRQDTAPDSEGLVYSFAPLPPPLVGNQQLIPLTDSPWRLNAQDTDPGVTWKDLDYDDTQAGWSAGPGLFGFTGNPAAYPAPIATTWANTLKTAYLRKHFTWTNAPTDVILVVSSYLSDGAVFYVNGAEVKRLRLPEGTVSFATPATGGPAVKGQPEIFGIPTGPLVQGDNVLAVEVHQSAGDTTDLVFGASLLAATSYPVVIADPALPADQTVVAGESATFAVEVLATPPVSYQWFKDTTPIQDATNSTYTLAVVLPGDAGPYSVKVSNPPSATGVTSRAAQLTVKQTQVAIADATQPADQTVVEGTPFTFTVRAEGSAPLSYQWFKNDSPIDGATNVTYGLPVATSTNAADYFVRVSNPFPSSIDSRTAKLVVAPDRTPPSLTKVEGGPDKVIITFSEPVEETSANTASNYGVSGGVKVNRATRSADNAAQVVLTTSGQVLGTRYTLTVHDVRDRFGNSISAATTTEFLSTILIDGIFDDWAGVPLAYTDPQESPAAGTDFKELWVTNDNRYLYLRFTLYTPGDPNTWLNNIFIDADNNSTTGFLTLGIGSEIVIQQGAGYQEKNGDFNEGTVDGLDWAVVPTGEGTDFECRISRRATYTSDGQPVFTNATIRLMLETEDANYNTTDTAPDSGGLEYTFVNYPVDEFGLSIILLDNGRVRITFGGGTLQSTPSLTKPSWSNVPNVTSPYETVPDGSERYYRVAR